MKITLTEHNELILVGETESERFHLAHGVWADLKRQRVAAHPERDDEGEEVGVRVSCQTFPA